MKFPENKQLVIYLAARGEFCDENETPLRAEFLDLSPEVGQPVAMGNQIRWTTTHVNLFDSSDDNSKTAWIVYVVPILEEYTRTTAYDGYREEGQLYDQSIEVFFDKETLRVLDVHINFSGYPMMKDERVISVEPTEQPNRFIPVNTEWVAVGSEELEPHYSNNFDRVYLTYCERLPIPVSAA